MFAWVPLLGACGHHSSQALSQVVIKVDDTEISVHQFNSVLQRLPPMSSTELEAKKSEILKALVQQQVASNQAIKLNLDRTPDALLLLDAARRDMLTQLYVAEYAKQAAYPATDEIQKYYAANPYYFAERKSYILLELEVAGSDDVLPQLEEALNAGRSVENISLWLTAQLVPHSTSLSEKSGDQLSPAMAAALATVGVGGVKMEKLLKDGVSIIHFAEIKQTKNSPLKFTEAQNEITNRLYTQKAAIAVPQQLARLVQTSKVQYIGDFSRYDAPKNQSEKTP
jgi:EpsD family peptidyl-prolyl cis-trans isomerase